MDDRLKSSVVVVVVVVVIVVIGWIERFPVVTTRGMESEIRLT